MKFEHQRGSILILFEKLTQLPLLIATVIVTVVAGAGMDYQLVSWGVVVAISPFFQLIKYLFTYYTVRDGQLIIESGVLNRKRVEIPLRTVTTVDLTQNILFQLFRTYKIKVDNGSQARGAANAPEVKFALKEAMAYQFKNLVEEYRENAGTTDELNATAGKTAVENETTGKNETAADKKQSGIPRYQSPTVTTSPLDYFLLGILESNAVFLLGLVPVITVFPFLSDMGFLPEAESVEKFMEQILASYSAGLIVIVLLLALFLSGTVLSVFRSVFTYFGFEITADPAKIHISYGLLTKRKYTLQKDKINGIVLKQNLLMRLFRRYRMEVLVIGYGDKSDEEAKQNPVFFPIASRKKVAEIMGALLPEFAGDYCAYDGESRGKEPRFCPRSDNKALRYFFIRPGFVVSTVLFIGSVVSLFFDTKLYFGTSFSILGGGILFAIAGMIEGAAAVSAVLQYLNSGISANPDIVTIVTGGYHRKITVIRTSAVESVTAHASRWKRRRGFVSIRLGYIAPLYHSITCVRNRRAAEVTALESVLDY